MYVSPGQIQWLNIFQFYDLATNDMNARTLLKVTRIVSDANVILTNPSFPISMLPPLQLTLSFTKDLKHLLLNLASRTIPLNLPLNSKQRCQIRYVFNSSIAERSLCTGNFFVGNTERALPMWLERQLERITTNHR